jgi:hypothetical protein
MAGCLLRIVWGLVRDAADALTERAMRSRYAELLCIVGLLCWTLIVGITPGLLLTLDLRAAGALPTSEHELRSTVSVTMCCCSVPAILLFALPAYVAVISYASSHSLPPDEPTAKKFPDFSPMPDEFEDFAWRLEQAKQMRGTLVCYECGHYNPVGQSQCQECGSWVPQTAEARWAYRPRPSESSESD